MQEILIKKKMIMVAWGENVLRGEVGMAAPTKWISIYKGSQKTQKYVGKLQSRDGGQRDE